MPFLPFVETNVNRGRGTILKKKKNTSPGGIMAAKAKVKYSIVISKSPRWDKLVMIFRSMASHREQSNSLLLVHCSNS